MMGFQRFQRLWGCFAILVVLVTGSVPSLGQDRSLLQQAGQQIENGNFAEAELLLRDYLKQRERDSLATYLLGVALSAQGKIEESDRYLHKALELDRRLHLAVRFLGVNAFQAGDQKSARQYLQRYLRHVPGDEVAHLTLARLSLAESKYPEALKHLSLAKQLVQQDPHLQLLVAEALLGANQREEAKRTVLAVRSEDPVVFFEAGLLLARAEYFAEALERFEKARAGYPDPAAVQFNLALAHFQMGSYSTAISILTEMITAGVADADVNSLLGDAYVRLDRHREARESLEKAVSLAPDDARHYVDLLALFVETEEVEAGLRIAQEAVRRHADPPELYALRGALYFLKNQAELAEADYRKGLQLAPDNEWLFINLVTLLALHDRLEEAKSLLENRWPKFKGYYSYFIYADVLRRMGLDRSGPSQERARECLEKSIQLNRHFPPALLYLGRLYAARKDWPRALGHFEAARNLDPGDKRPYYELYKLYREMGDLEKAQKMLAVVTIINQRESGKTPVDNIRERIEALKQAARAPREVK